MIARIWRGHTREADAEAYTKLIERTGIVEYRATPGNLGAAIFRRANVFRPGDAPRPPDPQGTVEFVVLSFWEDWDAIRKFAGEDVEKAHYYPEDDAYLLGKEPHVAHYEVPSSAGLKTELVPEALSSVRLVGEEA